MPTMTLTNDQIVDLFKQLPPTDKRTALFVLAGEANNQQQARRNLAEIQLQKLATERNLDWNTMSEDAREEFIDDLLHEELA